MAKEFSIKEIEELKKTADEAKVDIVRSEEKIKSLTEQKKKIAEDLEKVGVECQEEEIGNELKKTDKKILEEKQKIEEIFDKLKSEKVAVS